MRRENETLSTTNLMPKNAGKARVLLIAVLAVIGTICTLVVVAVIRTKNIKSGAVNAEKAAVIDIDEDAADERLAEAIRFKTISYHEPPEGYTGEFPEMQAYLEAAYPEVFKTLSKEVIGGHSLLLKWEGRNESEKPVLLLAHQDTVPVIEGTESDWTYPPFEGVIADGYIWGRGALDDKSSICAILEAVELLLRDGFTPERTIYIAFGHDEEISGVDGATNIVSTFEERGIRFEAVLDEGGFITNGMVQDVDRPVALVGIAEKGYLTLSLTAEAEGGHSSMPPPNTAVGIVSRAVTKLEDHPFPARLDGAALEMFQTLAPSMPYVDRMALANLWLSRPLVLKEITKSQQANALVRTTTAATMLKGSDKENVLPIKAIAVVNFRILPGETAESVTKRVEEIIDDPRVKVEVLGTASDPSPVSDTDAPFYRAIEKSVLEVSTDEPPVVAPYLLVAATDSRHYIPVADNIYRFIAVTITPEILSGLHGTDERIAATEYIRAVKFYYQLLRNIN